MFKFSQIVKTATAVLLVAALTVFTLTSPTAYAQVDVEATVEPSPTDEAVPTPGSLAQRLPEVELPALEDAGLSDLRSGYSTLTASLLDRFAQTQQSPASGDAFLQANSSSFDELSKSLGLGAAGSGLTVASLDKRLTEVTIGSGYSLNGIGAALAEFRTPDSVAVGSAVELSAKLGKLDMPALNSAGLVNRTELLRSADDEQILFGLFANTSLAEFAKSAPDVSDLLSGSGLSDGSAKAAWQKAQADAAGALSSDLGANGVLNPCHAVMINAMAAGSATLSGSLDPAGNCGACAVAGSYLHGSMGKVFDTTSTNLTQNSTDGRVNAAEWGSLADWQKASVLEANPGLTGAFTKATAGDRGLSKSSSECDASSKAATGWFDDNLGSILGDLAG